MLTEPERSPPRLRFCIVVVRRLDDRAHAKHGGVDGVLTSAFATQAALDARTRGACAVSMSAHRAGALAAAVTFLYFLLLGVSLAAHTPSMAVSTVCCLRRSLRKQHSTLEPAAHSQ